MVSVYSPTLGRGWPPPRRPGVGEIVFAVLVGAWFVVVTGLTQVVAWAIEQFLLIEGLSMPAYGWPIAVWINAILVAAPALLLTRIARRPTTRAVGRTWLIASLVLGIVGSLRAIPAQQSEIYFTALALLTTACAVILHTISRRTATARKVGIAGRADQAAESRIDIGPAAPMLGIAGGIAVLIPWLWAGALGGRLETALAILAAAGCGALAAETLQPLWTAYAATPRRAGPVLVAGLAAGVALVPLAAAYGASGPHLAQMLGLPLLGIVGAALTRCAAGRPTIGALIGFAVLGPLALVEADETSVLLGLHEVGYWAAVGGLCSMGAALVLAISALVAVRLIDRSRPIPDPATSRMLRESDAVNPTSSVKLRGSWIAGVRAGGEIGGRALVFGRTKAKIFAASTALALAAVGAIVVYPLAGHPGFFGERLFVVMKAQADLSGLDQITDLTARREQTYRRLVEEADMTQKSLRAELTRKHLRFTPYYLVDGILVDDGPQARIWLSRRGDVDRVLLNPTLRPIPAAAAPMRGSLTGVPSPLWNISMIGAPGVWASGDTGQGVVIGSSDTGVDLAHPALTASYRGGDDSWYDPWNGTTTPVDHDGHGTHTMGSALGSGGIGVAPGAQWMGCVNLDRDMGNPAYYLDCLQFMLAPFGPGGNAFAGNPARAADILTNSWGCPALEGCDTTALEPAVDALTAAGIFFVAAAGNEGPRCGLIEDAPAPYADTFTVGAVDRHGKLALFSSRGPVAGLSKPDVLAPGVDVISALPGGGYGALDGTSMATPQVAGVVALMWSANPSLRGNVARTAQILRTTSSASAGSCGSTAGLVNATAAVAVLR